jgi:hypothetical protein
MARRVKREQGARSLDTDARRRAPDELLPVAAQEADALQTIEQITQALLLVARKVE